MKMWVVTLAVALAFSLMGRASADEVAPRTLQQMGLAGMAQASDADGLAVRGAGMQAVSYAVARARVVNNGIAYARATASTGMSGRVVTFNQVEVWAAVYR